RRFRVEEEKGIHLKTTVRGAGTVPRTVAAVRGFHQEIFARFDVSGSPTSPSSIFLSYSVDPLLF
ncbi:MAG: hypothetical protein ACFE9L_20295, partial [Candidatus Hodarchaeota archaeon]